MKIHFAFGQLWKQGLLDQQCNDFLELILGQKRLKVSTLTEFLPIFPHPRGIQVDKDGTAYLGHELDLTKGEIISDDKGISLAFNLENISNLYKPPHINYAPEDVSMISFIDIPFNKLRHSNHSQEYGKLGIVFTDEYYKRKNLRHVQYYTEEDVVRDTYINQWNDNLRDKTISGEELKSLIYEITLFRKPALLFDNFARSVTAVLRPSSVEFITYNRYPNGYDFTQERECRISFISGEEYLYFDERDVYMVIVPGEGEKNLVETFFGSA